MIFDLQLFAGLYINLSKSDDVITLGENLDETGISTALNGTGYSILMENTALSVGAAADLMFLSGVSIGTASVSTFYVSGVSIGNKLNDSKLIISNSSVGELDFGANTGVVSLKTVADNKLNFGGSGTATKRTLEIASATELTLESTGAATSVAGLTGAGTLTLKNSKYAAEFVAENDLSGISVLASKSSDLKFSAKQGVLNLGAGTDTVKIDLLDGASVSLGLTGVESAIITNTNGSVNINTLKTKSFVTLTATDDLDLAIVGTGVDSTSGVLFNAGAYTQNLDLSGKGVETLAATTDTLENKKMAVNVNNWAVTNGSLTSGMNVLNVGSADISNLTTSYTDTLKLQYDGAGVLEIQSQKDAASLSKAATGVAISNGKTVTDVLFTSGSAMDATDDSYNMSNFEVIVANGEKDRNILNLGDRTDEKVVWLAGDGKTEKYGVTQKLVGFSSVVSSSATSSLLISDLAKEETFLLGAGEGDSIFTGVGGTAKSTLRDTVASAAGKSAYIGTSNYSGVDLILNDTSAIYGVESTKFDFADFDSSTGSITSGDVITLMHGAGHMRVNKGNFEVGADDENYLVLQSAGDGQKDVAYSNEIGGDKQLARVDMSTKNGTLAFNEHVDFYVGNDTDTTITYDSSVTNSKLNYDGGAVMLGVAAINASLAGAGNVIYGKSGVGQEITASASGATSICGGLAGEGDYADTGIDVLVGGKDTTFYVGENMGSDRVTNIQSGDTVVFLGTKYEGNAGIVNTTAGTTISFDNGTSIKLEAAKNMSDVTSLTTEFDDCTWKWDGANWTYTAK